MDLQSWRCTLLLVPGEIQDTKSFQIGITDSPSKRGRRTRLSHG